MAAVQVLGRRNGVTSSPIECTSLIRKLVVRSTSEYLAEAILAAW